MTYEELDSIRNSKQELTIEFIEEHFGSYENYADWKPPIEYNTKNTQLSEEFMLNHPDQVSWKYIQCQRNVPEYILDLHIHEINLSALMEGEYPFSMEFIDKHWDTFLEFDETSENMLYYLTLPENRMLELLSCDGYNNMIVESHNNYITTAIYIRLKELNTCDLDDIFYGNVFSEEFLENNIDKPYNWNKQLDVYRTETFLEKYQELLRWENIVSGQILSEDFIDSHINDLEDWELYQSEVSEQFLESHVDVLHWHELLSGQQLTEEFIDRHISKMKCFL